MALRVLRLLANVPVDRIYQESDHRQAAQGWAGQQKALLHRLWHEEGTLEARELLESADRWWTTESEVYMRRLRAAERRKLMSALCALRRLRLLS